MTIYVLTSGNYEDFDLDAIVSGSGDLDVLQKEFETLAESLDDNFSYSYRHDKAFCALGLLDPPVPHFVRGNFYFARWLVREKGFTEVDYITHKTDF